MKWNAEGSGCGNQLIHLDAGEISSMNYPQNYEQNLDCDWTIQTDPGSHLILRSAFKRFLIRSFPFRVLIGYLKADKSFRELFLEGDSDNSGTCNAGCTYPGCSCCDYVEILDSDEEKRLGRFCGTKIPPQIIRFVRHPLRGST